MKITTHPMYQEKIEMWTHYRHLIEGGEVFIDHYLQRFALREANNDWTLRRSITYNPGIVLATIREIFHPMISKLSEVHRRGGDVSYQSAMQGLDGGVDNRGHSMSVFLADHIILEMLCMGKVGVFVDSTVTGTEESQLETIGKHPYIYRYCAEDILNWVETNGILTKLLLRTQIPTYNDEGFIDNLVIGYQYFNRVSDDTIIYKLMAKDPEGKDNEVVTLTTKTLNLERIPFVTFEIPSELLRDTFKHQVAILNLASSEMFQAIKGLFSLYVEMYDPNSPSTYTRPSALTPNPGTQQLLDTDLVGASPTELLTLPTMPTPNVGANVETTLGPMRGRRVPKGLEFPQFLTPSSDPILTSLKLREAIGNEVRRLVNLTVSEIGARSQSAAAKMLDLQAFEAGLSYIGNVLQVGEQRIAEIWADYQSHSQPAKVEYPTVFNTRTVAERIEDATKLVEAAAEIPSQTAKKELHRQAIASLLTGQDLEVITKAQDEITNLDLIVDYSQLLSDIENGLVSPETSSLLRGYDTDEAEKAELARARRLALTQAAQTPRNGQQPSPGARGLKDASVDPSLEAKLEKAESQSADKSPTGKKAVRGKAV